MATDPSLVSISCFDSARKRAARREAFPHDSPVARVPFPFVCVLFAKTVDISSRAARRVAGTPPYLKCDPAQWRCHSAILAEVGHPVVFYLLFSPLILLFTDSPTLITVLLSALTHLNFCVGICPSEPASALFSLPPDSPLSFPSSKTLSLLPVSPFSAHLAKDTVLFVLIFGTLKHTLATKKKSRNQCSSCIISFCLNAPILSWTQLNLGRPVSTFMRFPIFT